METEPLVRGRLLELQPFVNPPVMQLFDDADESWPEDVADAGRLLAAHPRCP